jgi:hypothetical protein
MLMPAAVLVVIILGAISVDAAVVFGAQRELVDSAQAAANDAAAYGIDEGAFRAGRGYVYDASRVDDAVDRALAARGVRARRRWYVRGDRIVVELQESVAYVFTKAVPGAGDSTTVHARADARLMSH